MNIAGNKKILIYQITDKQPFENTKMSKVLISLTLGDNQSACR